MGRPPWRGDEPRPAVSPSHFWSYAMPSLIASYLWTFHSPRGAIQFASCSVAALQRPHSRTNSARFPPWR
jgi:hypothetical protein